MTRKRPPADDQPASLVAAVEQIAARQRAEDAFANPTAEPDLRYVAARARLLMRRTYLASLHPRAS